jgi:ABC-2 type transport system permease protein/oleandomycin transport system permease protein
MPETVEDALVILKRNLIRFVRQPELLVGYTVQPIMFVLLFVYVFGGAIDVPGGDYAQFLIPGILVQNITFGGAITAVGLTEDMNKGLIDRFRSLPMARSAVLAGRTLADVFVNFFAMVIVIVVGLIVGFSFNSTVGNVIYGVVLLLAFGYAFSWIFALIGMSVSSSETAQQFGFIVIFPLTFISSAFVPVQTMPSALQAFAKANPFTITVDAMRHLFIGTPAGDSVWQATLWTVGLIVVFAPLAVLKYRSVSAR